MTVSENTRTPTHHASTARRAQRKEVKVSSDTNSHSAARIPAGSMKESGGEHSREKGDPPQRCGQTAGIASTAEGTSDLCELDATSDQDVGGPAVICSKFPLSGLLNVGRDVYIKVERQHGDSVSPRIFDTDGKPWDGSRSMHKGNGIAEAREISFGVPPCALCQRDNTV